MVLTRLDPVVGRRSLGILRLWRDDIAEMVTVFREAVSDHDVLIQTDTYELSTVDDLALIDAPRVDRLIVTGEQGRLRLEFGPLECQAEVTDPDLRARGMLAELTRISERRRRRLPKPWQLVSIAISTALFIIILFKLGFSHLNSLSPQSTH